MYCIRQSSHAPKHNVPSFLFYTVTELTSWSQWTCFNGTIASRNRTTQICTGVEYIDPVTNMTMTNTSCDNVTEIDRRTGNYAYIAKPIMIKSCACAYRVYMYYDIDHAHILPPIPCTIILPLVHMQVCKNC